MEKTKLNIAKFVKKNRLEVILLVIILLVSAFMRLYRIEGQMTFLGDEGRDVRVVTTLLHGHIVAIGPQTSIGNMYLGPLYYYMMAPALFLSNYNPVGPAVMIALLGVLTIAFTWWVGRSWFNPKVGLVAAFLFGLSPVAIIYSRSSWNPNPMPFFALLCIWGIYQLKTQHNFKWLLLVAASFGFALQMHYLGLLLAPTLALVWLVELYSIRRETKKRNLALKYTGLALLVFLFLMSPLFFFDLKHQGMNFKAFKAFFSDRQTTINFNPTRSDRFGLILSQITTDFFTARQALAPILIGILIAITGIIASLKQKNKLAIGILGCWLFVGFIGLTVYKQHVYDHYYGFLWPAFYLLAGLILAYLINFRNFIFKTIGIIILLVMALLSFKYSPTWDNPNNQLARTEKVVKQIIQESKGQPFNFGLIAKQNYDESYRYFLELYHAKYVRGEDKITDQLFVVCENGDTCQPLNDPGYQIAIFGPAKIDKQWMVDYLHLYRLIHSK